MRGENAIPDHLFNVRRRRVIRASQGYKRTWPWAGLASLALTALVSCVPPSQSSSAASTAIASSTASPISTWGVPHVRDLDLTEIREMTPGSQGAHIRYRLTAPGIVRIRIVDRDTPGIIWRTLVDWEPRAAGAQAEFWDGRDRKGNPLDARQVSFVVTAQPGRQGLTEKIRPTLEALPQPIHKHALHPPEACGDLAVEISSPTPGQALTGTVELITRVQGGMPNPDYHLTVYLSGRAIWDGRVQGETWHYLWDTRSTPNAPYRLAVTYNDLHDHAGTDWIDIEIANP